MMLISSMCLVYLFGQEWRAFSACTGIRLIESSPFSLFSSQRVFAIGVIVVN